MPHPTRAIANSLQHIFITFIEYYIIFVHALLFIVPTTSVQRFYNVCIHLKFELCEIFDLYTYIVIFRMIHQLTAIYTATEVWNMGTWHWLSFTSLSPKGRNIYWYLGSTKYNK